jgi:hypothetical protein
LCCTKGSGEVSKNSNAKRRYVAGLEKIREFQVAIDLLHSGQKGLGFQTALSQQHLYLG